MGEGLGENGPQLTLPEVRRRDWLRVFAAILFAHAALYLMLTVFTNTAVAIPFFTVLFYIAVLSPSMVVVLRERPLEGIHIALPYLTTLPFWSVLICAALFALHAGLGYLLNLNGGGESLWLLGVLRSLVLNGIVMLFVITSASSLGLTAGFILDRNRLD